MGLLEAANQGAAEQSHLSLLLQNCTATTLSWKQQEAVSDTIPFCISYEENKM